MGMNDRLFIGIKGYVMCIDKGSGHEIWKTHLKSAALTNLTLDSDRIFAHAGGHLFCLRASDGLIQWKNPLTGMGYGYCLFAGNDSAQAATAAAAQAAAAAAAAAGS